MNIHELQIGAMRFEWHEGNYIEVFDLISPHPFHAINVWDYSKDVPRIPRTHAAFVKECKKYYKELEV